MFRINEDFLYQQKLDLIDKKEFHFGRKMLLQIKAEDLGTTRKIIEVSAPTHAFKNDLIHKFSHKKAIKNGKSIVDDLKKGNTIFKLKKKILNNEELRADELRFIQKENLKIYEKKNLSDIIISHKNIFPLEKYHKFKEKEKIQKSKQQLKRSEKMKRMSAHAIINAEEVVYIFYFLMRALKKKTFK